MANTDLFRSLVQGVARRQRSTTAKPATSPTPRASARARAVASPNARFNRGTARPVQGPTKRMRRPKRGVTTTRRAGY